MSGELRERILRLLREIEWSGEDGCPSCQMYRHLRNGQHEPDCELAALIRELEGE